VVPLPRGAGDSALLTYVSGSYHVVPSVDGGWAEPPTQYFHDADVDPDCANNASTGPLLAFGLHPGDPADQVVGWVGEGWNACAGYGVWVYSLSERRATVLTFEANAEDIAGVQAADVDGDGNTDLVVLNNGEVIPVVYRGDGAGHFQAVPLPVRLTAAPAAVLAADFDGDHLPDLAFIAENGTVSILYQAPGFVFR
jgi:hypothetical protein